MMESALISLQEKVSIAFGEGLKSVSYDYDELTLSVEPSVIVALLRYLRDDPDYRFVCLIDICGVDYPQRSKRFDVVYHLLSPYKNLRIRVKLETDEVLQVPSVISIFPAANWYEREAFDLYGILFSGHNDLRRLLTDYGFSGYPLRKDFPLTGEVEVRYDDDLKKVVYDKVRLVQEYRSFDYLSPWGGDPMLPGDEKAK